MDRFALFLDAGHVLAESGALCCNTKKRSEIHCDFAGLIGELSQYCEGFCGLSMLRAYWYDAAPDATPTPEQLVIARLPRTKLRLGRLVGGKQKGVDSLVVRDLMTLARERAIATAFLLGGDDDLREGMLAAQEVGVAVNVLGIPAPVGIKNQADTLIREADQHIMLPAALLCRFFNARNLAAPAAIPPPLTSPSVSPSTATPSMTPLVATTTTVPPLLDSIAVITAAGNFAETWYGGQDPNEVAQLIAGAPVIPPPLDRLLLSSIQAKIGGSLRGREDLRKDARAAFWNAIRTLALRQIP
jgi:uncharacterized LabA/DUF88 family protein